MNQASIEKKHISLIIPSLTSGGAERVFSVLANELNSSYSITLFVLYKCEIAYPLNKNIEIVFCRDLYAAKQSLLKSITSHFNFIKFLKQEISKRQSIGIVSFTTTTNVYAILIGKRLKLPSIVSERLHPDYGINTLWKIVRKKVYPSCSKLVVQTKDIKDYFNDFMPNDKISIIENPLSPKLIHQKSTNTSKEKTILSVGRLTHQKNQELLIRAFYKIDIKNWNLCIVGEGDKRKKYEDLVTKLNIKGRVTFTGSVPNIADYLNTASIFVLCSRFEGFPNALIEAMYFGLPCIATNCPSGPEDIIVNNKNGILIPVEDEAKLTEALKKLIINKELRETLGKNAAKTALRFEGDTILSKWKTLIKSEMG